MTGHSEFKVMVYNEIIRRGVVFSIYDFNHVTGIGNDEIVVEILKELLYEKRIMRLPIGGFTAV
jgi:hypothetical protein